MTKDSRTTKARSRRARKEAAAPPAPSIMPASATKLDQLAGLTQIANGSLLVCIHPHVQHLPTRRRRDVDHPDHL